jgi:glycosyltransferase involved in cell wall biosynthesis
MRRIVYVAKLEVDKSQGIKKKIFNQVESWRKLCPELDVYLLIIYPKIAIIKDSIAGSICIYETSFWQKYIFNPFLYREMRRLSADLVYFRFSNFPIINLIHLLSFRVVLELNTRFEFEVLHYKNTMKRLLLKLYYKFIFKFSVGQAAVTPECIVQGGPASIVIGNSISVDDYKPCVEHDIRKTSMELVFIGSPDCAWHGVDRIFEIAKDLANYKFNIIGYSKEDMESIGLNQIPSNVQVHGFLIYDEYLEIFTRCFAAIGSLAMERNRMFFSSSLKNREYLVHGLPVVVQGVDTDLLNLDSVYFLGTKFDSNDFKFAIEHLRFSAPKSNQLMRSIDSDVLERQRLNFLLNI